MKEVRSTMSDADETSGAVVLGSEVRDVKSTICTC